MRLIAAISGDLRKIVQDEIRGAQKAVVDGLREAGKGLRDDLRAHTAGADLGKLARSWTLKVFRGRSALSAAALVYPDGKAAHAAMWAFEHGVTIRPYGQYLTIPTQFNRRLGRRGGKVIYQPHQLSDSFVMRSKRGALLLMARVQHAQRMTRSGTVRDLAAVNSHILGSGRKKRSNRILGYGVVPMFILKSEVRVPKRLDVAGVAARWDGRAADIILKAWEREAGVGHGG